MKRNALVFFALAVTVFALASMVPVGPQQATGFISGEDTTVVLRRMYEGLRPDTWGADVSPDGRYVTQTDKETGDLAVLDLLTGESRRVTAKPTGGSDDSYSESAQFSPDGLAIAYAWWSESDGDYDIRVIDIDGSNERIVSPRDPDSLSWHYLHDWSPDGTQLLDTFCRRGVGGGQCDLRLIDVEDGSTQVLHVEEEDGVDPVAGFSPDGRYVAFSVMRGASDGSRGPADLYVIPVDGGREQVLLSGPQADGFLGWSPTGGDILFLSDRDLTEGVWRLPVRNGQATGAPELVKADMWRLRRIGVSNGRLFYGITSQQREIFTAGLDLTRGRFTSPPATLGNPPGAFVRNPAWSPDGKLLAHILYPGDPYAGNPVLVIRSIDGEQTREIPSPFKGRVGRIWWGPDRDKLIVRGTVGDRGWRGLLQIDLETGETSRYLKSESVWRWATLTADRKIAYYAEWSNPSPDSAYFLKRHDLVTGEVENLARLDTLLTGLVYVRHSELSPDERSLAFQGYNRETEKWTVGVISTASGEARGLATQDRQVVNPSDPNDRDVNCRMIAWTPDGQSVVYARAVTGQLDCSIYSVPAAGGEARPLGKMPSHESPATVSPDHSRVAFLAGEVRGELWMMDNIPWSSDR